MKPSLQTASGSLSRRLRFPEDEDRLPWLPPLLDCHAISDTGVAIALRDAQKKRKKNLACRQGCDVCCRQPDIPVYPHELPGLRWFIAEKLVPAVRGMVMRQCAEHGKGASCPFLADHACAVHPVRPLACRQYNVFTTPCSPGEDPYFSRRDDVLVPITDYTDRAFAAVAGFYGLERERDAGRAATKIKAKIMNLQEQDWRAFAESLR